MSQEDFIKYPFLPVGGTDLTAADDRVLGQNPLRDAYNIRIQGAEVWTREGIDTKRYAIASLPFIHAVSLDLIYGTTTTTRHFLVAHWGVVEVNVTDWSLSVPYSPEWTGTIDYTGGSASATVASKTSGAGTTIQVDALLIAKDSDGLNTVYRITARSAASGIAGTTLTLDRVYAHSTALAAAANIYTRPGSAAAAVGTRSKIHYCTWTVFRQRVTLAAAAVWNDGATTSPYYTEQSPALAAGDLLFVLCAGITDSGVPRGPFAFKLNATAAPVFELHRKTADSLTAATAFSGAAIHSRFLSTFRGRLLLSRCDENNENADRTVWYSEDGNALYWHTGNAGQNASHNYVKLSDGNFPITALRLMDDRMIVHRTRGYAALVYRETAVDPFQVEYRSDGMGFGSSASIVDVDGVQYGWSEYGPAAFDGDRFTPLDAQVGQLARHHFATSEYPTDYNPYSVVGVYHRARQQIWWNMLGSGRIIVYDIRTRAATVHEATSASSTLLVFGLGVIRTTSDFTVGGQEVIVASSEAGSLIQRTQTNKGKDSPLLSGGAATTIAANFATRWHAPNNFQQATLLKLQIEFRAFPTIAGFLDYLGDYLQSGSGTDFSFTVRVFMDKDMLTTSTSPAVTVTIPYASFYDRRGTVDGSLYGPMSTFIYIQKMSHPDGSLITGETFRLKYSTTDSPFRISQIIGFFRPAKTTRREAVL